MYILWVQKLRGDKNALLPTLKDGVSALRRRFSGLGFQLDPVIPDPRSAEGLSHPVDP